MPLPRIDQLAQEIQTAAKSYPLRTKTATDLAKQITAARGIIERAAQIQAEAAKLIEITERFLTPPPGATQP